MPETLTPVTQHLAVWDDFGAIVSMLSDRRGLCFDARREVLRHVAGPAPLDQVGAVG
jgi:hypothetical protein